MKTHNQSRLYNERSDFAQVIVSAIAADAPATLIPMRRDDMAKGCVIRFVLGSKL